MLVLKMVSLYLSPCSDSSIVLMASPTTLNITGQWVTVTWSGVTNSSGGDWIGVFTPPTDKGGIDPKNHLPIKFRVSSEKINY